MSFPQESSASVKFQLLSDLHLQDSPRLYRYVVPANADYLLLAGDIGSLGTSMLRKPQADLREQERFKGFLARQCDQFKRVFIIAGNHEYWHNSIPFGNSSLKSFEQDVRMGGRLTVLEEDRFDLMDKEGKILVTILGATMWSRIRSDQPDAGMGDVGAIPNNSQVAHTARFAKSYQWLRDEVANVRKESKTRRIVVMTHHAPLIRGTSQPLYDGPDGRTHRWSAYQNDILVFGHTHWTTSFKQDDVQVYANQRGGAEENRGLAIMGLYDVRFTFEM